MTENPPKPPITNIIFGTMTLGYHGYGARVETRFAAAQTGMDQRLNNERILFIDRGTND